MNNSNFNSISNSLKIEEEKVQSHKNIGQENIKLEALKEQNEKQKNIDLEKAKKLSEEIKKNKNPNKIADILENGNIDISNLTIEKFIDYGKELWFSSLNPVSLILKSIWENYLYQSELNPIWFLMMYEQLKESIYKWNYDWWKNEWKEIKEELKQLKNDMHIFLAIYPKILEKMFWKQVWEDLRKQFKWANINITNELENEVLLYYKEKDEKLSLKKEKF